MSNKPNDTLRKEDVVNRALVRRVVDFCVAHGIDPYPELALLERGGPYFPPRNCIKPRGSEVK